MLRFIFVIIVCLPDIIYYVPKMRRFAANPEKYDEDKCYSLARRMVKIIKTKGLVFTKGSGYENLPKEGGYVMFPNHQGKYDVLGIVATHKNPCTFVMDSERAKLPIAKEFISMMKGVTLDKTSIRQQRAAIRDIAQDVAEGKRYIIFPEGGYKNNRNNLQKFYNGCFRSAIDAKAPIVPVALIDSYKVFTGLTIRPIFTKVYYLEPLYYEDYKSLKTCEISEIVRTRIDNLIASKKKRR